ncbi:BLUF domain-containing protein [Iodobacter fluviatilis]|uniref:Blue light- and temperature-regulated antirepressor YcgF n=1 Tax=Iodobacter fluviatilis TaxID=537 RepID=A0A377Q8D6_9NEIS|nr:BLUF domain-containing protein [Iodobacter fluviatilis]TCU80237.1 FAD-dependent sensor of blue light [Iodobacter fluviatilis]STQ91514.1 Blue light- and temperature-regulated antirepressor YcgF [Iodobacter fluviatilis]
MSDLHSLVYVSTATHLMSDAELEALLLGAVEQNNKNDVTGVLLYNDGDFMQCLEGPERVLRETFKRISGSRQHSGIICLFDEKINKRSFSDWHMGYAKTSKSQMLALSSAQWKKIAEASAEEEKEWEGLILLRDFWSRR